MTIWGSSWTWFNKIIIRLKLGYVLILLGNEWLNWMVSDGCWAAFTYISVFSGLVDGFTIGGRFTYLGEFSGLLG